MTLDELNAAALNCEADTDAEVTDDTDDDDDDAEDFESELVEAVELLDKCMRFMERITVKGGRVHGIPSIRELTDLLAETQDLLDNYPEINSSEL